MLHLDPTKRPQINEIMCNPLVINAYMNYYADLGMIPMPNRVPTRTISFSADNGSAGMDGRNGVGSQNGMVGLDATAKPSLKQVGQRLRVCCHGPSLLKHVDKYFGYALVSKFIQI